MHTIENSNLSWKNNTFRFLGAQAVSLFGSALVQYAIIWHITLSTSSGKMLTISTLCGFVPQIAVSLFAGVWIDRYDRKKLIMLSDSLIAVATLLLAVSFLSGHRNLLFLFAVLAVRSAGTGIQTPAVNALVPLIVPREKLMRVNGIQSTISSLIMFLSPALSGALLAVASLEFILLIDVVTAVLGVAVTATVAVNQPEKKLTQANSHLKEIAAGLTYVRKNPFVLRLLVFQIVVLFLISPSAFLTPLMVARRFGPEVWRLSLSEMTYSFGMIAGGLLISLWGGFKKRLKTTQLAGILYGVLMIGLGLAPVFAVYLILNALIGITSPCYNAPITVSIQERVEPLMHGRVFSLLQIATSCALPLGMVVFGPLADVTGVPFLLIFAGSAVLLTAATVFVRRQLE